MREPQNLRIGLFDSGVGGLTVLKQMYAKMPNESLLYFADTARLPYGVKSQIEILEYVRQILDWMSNLGVKMVIMACNTSSALALETVREEYDFPILGLILPAARAAAKEGKKIGVICTQATAQSNAYQNAIQEINSDILVWQVACPEFVMLIEQNQIYSPYTRAVVEKYLQRLLKEKIDTLIYGCTHYQHLEKIFRSVLPESIKIIDPAEYIVLAAEKELELMGLKTHTNSLPTRFCVSGCPQQFAELSQQWLGYIPHVEKISLCDSSQKTVSPKTLDG